jgi:TIR domain-containing protein
MAHDVFISHARKDEQIAHAICEKLESAQVKCWIAQRDMPAGEDWTEATRNAIESSHLLVLLLSENASAAVHIEREMAHAFYTRRLIIPLRLTDTLPRREFLFYLGNVRSFDAFGPTAEHQLEAFSTAIHGLVRDHSETREATTLHPAQGAAAIPVFSESWLGALQASHYQTLEILKRVAIVASVAGAICLFWFTHQQNERETSLEGNSRAWQSSARDSPDLPPRGSADASALKPAYAYTRLGLWVAPNTDATLAPLQGTQDSLAVSKDSPPAGSPLPARSSDSEITGEGESLQNQGQNVHSLPGDRQRTGIRRAGHRGKSRPKSHQKRVSGSLLGQIAQIKSRLIAGWQQWIARSKETRNR